MNLQNTQDTHVFKSFGLQKISDVYSDFNSGKEIYFLNSENEPVKVKNITKEEYPEFNEHEISVLNDLRVLRNRVAYEGFFVEISYVRNAL